MFVYKCMSVCVHACVQACGCVPVCAHACACVLGGVMPEELAGSLGAGVAGSARKTSAPLS